MLTELQRELWREKLLIDGILLPSPENLANFLIVNLKLDWVKLNWLACKKSQYFTDMTMTDIETYSFKNIVRTSPLWKRGKILYESRHVSHIEYNHIPYCTKFCYVRGIVSQARTRENPYSAWVCLNTILFCVTYTFRSIVTLWKNRPALRTCVCVLSFLLFEFYRLRKLNWAA